MRKRGLSPLWSFGWRGSESMQEILSRLTDAIGNGVLPASARAAVLASLAAQGGGQPSQSANPTQPSTCSLKVLCAPIPVLRILGIVHCLLQVSPRGNPTLCDRWELWHDTVVPRRPRSARIGAFVYVNLNPCDVGVGGGPPYEVYSESGVATCDKVDCIARSSINYKYRNVYGLWPFGPNSNTYIRKMCNYCNIPAKLPAGALGQHFP
jgi:hypothetical protein